MSDAIDDLLEERTKIYGSFLDISRISQGIKEILNSAIERRDTYVTADQRESLDMIANKLARIVNGDADYIDNWDDIAGYAKLVADRLRGVVR